MAWYNPAMSTAERILERLRALPPERQQAVLDFAEFLCRKATSAGPAVNEDFNLKPMRLFGWPPDCRFRREDIYGA